MNAIIQLSAAGLGLLALTWPWLKGLGGLWQGLKPAPEGPPAGPTYTTAIENLASVRARLKGTACLAEEQMKAIDVLTLALVAGSDKP